MKKFSWLSGRFDRQREERESEKAPIRRTDRTDRRSETDRRYQKSGEKAQGTHSHNRLLPN